MSEIRLDSYLVEKGYFSSREKAKQAIKAGLVLHAETSIAFSKPSLLIADEIPLTIVNDGTSYVSRGGLKLAGALESFDVDVKNKIALDIGASTGGFTECLLRNGSTFVYALDVGTNQLDPSIREDTRVKSLEQTNFRYIEKTLFTEGLPNIIVTDVSFISLTIIIDKVAELFWDNTFDFIALIKPQFELEKRKIGKKGVVRDKKLQQYAIDKISDHVNTTKIDWKIMGIIPSPITGTKGNQEFLIHIKKGSEL